MTPDASEGDWVLVHAGFAIQQLDETEAAEIWEYLNCLEPVEMPGPAADGDPLEQSGS